MMNLFLGIENNLPDWAWVLIVPVFLIVILAIVAFIIRLTKVIKLNRKFKGLPVEEEGENLLLAAYGGCENIVNVSKEMSRLTVEVKDLEKVNPDSIKELGAKNVLIVGNMVKSSFDDVDAAYAKVNGGK